MARPLHEPQNGKSHNPWETGSLGTGRTVSRCDRGLRLQDVVYLVLTSMNLLHSVIGPQNRKHLVPAVSVAVLPTNRLRGVLARGPVRPAMKILIH